MFESQRIMVVSGRASDLKCSCATLVQVCRPVLILEIKNLVTSRFLKVSLVSVPHDCDLYNSPTTSKSSYYHYCYNKNYFQQTKIL